MVIYSLTDGEHRWKLFNMYISSGFINIWKIANAKLEANMESGVGLILSAGKQVPPLSIYFDY